MRTAAAFIASVWLLSALICSPPWIVPQWNGLQMETHQVNKTSFIICGYTTSLSYRLYSASGSFFIPLALIIFIYARIYHIATSREKLLDKACNRGQGSGDKLRICYSQSQLTTSEEQSPRPATKGRFSASLLRKQRSGSALTASALKNTRIGTPTTPKSSFAASLSPLPPSPVRMYVQPSSSRDISDVDFDDVSTTLMPQPKASGVSMASFKSPRARASTQIRRERKAIITIG